MSRTPPRYVEGNHLLEGKTVLVTAAAGTGIGFATAGRCAEEGATVKPARVHYRASFVREVSVGADELFEDRFKVQAGLCLHGRSNIHQFRFLQEIDDVAGYGPNLSTV